MFKSCNRIAAILVIALIPVSHAAARESEWVKVNEDVYGSVNFIDITSIEFYQNNPRYLKFWLSEDARKNNTKKYVNSKMVKVVDCDRNTMATVAYADYAANGELVDSGSFTYLKFEELIPGTVALSWKNLVCAFRK